MPFALRSISSSAECGQILSVLGPNGVEKGPLFRCMPGLLLPQQSEALIGGTPIRNIKRPGKVNRSAGGRISRPLKAYAEYSNIGVNASALNLRNPGNFAMAWSP